MEFQNTIAYGTFTNDGGVYDFAGGDWMNLPFLPDGLEFNKNVNVAVGTEDFVIQVQQTGMYFAEFSFIAVGGDQKNYDIRPYVNNVAFNTSGSGQQIKFYQQPTEQKYEVSTHGLFNLTKNDTLQWKFFRSNLSTVPFTIKNIRLNIINLQQIGLH